MYVNINDYELLYLVNEGNEEAYNYIFHKYEPLIFMQAMKFCGYTDKTYDLAQEGKLILFNCIKKYNGRIGISFYHFLSLCLIRAYKIINEYDSYYVDIPCLREDISSYSTSIRYKSIMLDLNDKYKNDKITLDILIECVLGNLSLKRYAKNNNIEYHVVRAKHKLLLDYLSNYRKYYK